MMVYFQWKWWSPKTNDMICSALIITAVTDRIGTLWCFFCMT